MFYNKKPYNVLYIMLVTMPLPFKCSVLEGTERRWKVRLKPSQDLNSEMKASLK